MTPREEFEAWWGQAPIELQPMQPRTHEDALSAWVWKAWQAAQAAQPDFRTQLDDALKDKASVEKQFEEVKTSLRLCVDRLRFVESQNKALEIATEGEI